jgi:UDP-glucose 4-epimerase
MKTRIHLLTISSLSRLALARLKAISKCSGARTAMKHVLVTGGAGFIGSHLVDRLMNQGAFVRVLDDMSNGLESNISAWLTSDHFELLRGDIRNISDVKRAMNGIELVFHEAAKVSIPLSVKEPHLVFDVNVMGTATLLDECRKQDVEKIVVASSSSVYGNTLDLPKRETMPLLPISPYAVSKLAAENLAYAFYSTYGLNTTSLRYFNVYGPRQRGGAYAGVISIFIQQAKDGLALTINGDGRQTRDFTFIDDVVSCNLIAAESPKSKGRFYNVGGGSQISISELADLIIELTKSCSIKKYTEPRPGDVQDSLASLTIVGDDLDYRPKWTIRKGLEKTVDWVNGF